MNFDIFRVILIKPLRLRSFTKNFNFNDEKNFNADSRNLKPMS